MNEAYKSHVQLPASLLRGFCKKNDIWCMDSKLQIFHQNAKKCNVIEKYYSKEVEEFLANIETNFGNTKKRTIEEIRKNTFTWSYDDFINVKKLFFMTLARNPSYAKDVAAESVTRLLYDGTNQDFAITIMKLAIELDWAMRQDYQFNILANGSERELILPQTGISHMRRKDGNVLYHLPINSKVAITYIPKSLVDKENGKSLADCVSNASMIDLMNCAAIAEEFSDKKPDEYKMIYAEHRETLEYYRDNFDKVEKHMR